MNTLDLIFSDSCSALWNGKFLIGTCYFRSSIINDPIKIVYFVNNHFVRYNKREISSQQANNFLLTVFYG